MPILQVDLGHRTLLCSVDVSWFRGEFRSYNFVISVSDDGTNFRDIVSGKSTGTYPDAMRDIVLPITSTRYLRITVSEIVKMTVASHIMKWQ